MSIQKIESDKFFFDVDSHIDIIIGSNFTVGSNDDGKYVYFEKNVICKDIFKIKIEGEFDYLNLADYETLDAVNLHSSNVHVSSSTPTPTTDICRVNTLDINNVTPPSEVVFHTLVPIQLSNVYIANSLTIPYIQTQFMLNGDATIAYDLLLYCELLEKSFYSNLTSIPS